MDVEPGLVLRVEGPEDFGELAADLVVVLRQVVQAPLAQLERVVNLDDERYIWVFFLQEIFKLGHPAHLARFDNLERVLHDLCCGDGLRTVLPPRPRGLLHLGDDGDLDQSDQPLQDDPKL